MTKDLSKKLCEIAGIKPQYGIYPDFGQPENFVKLLEIYFRINKLSEVGSIEDILKRIINSAEINCGTKRMIREAEWKYE